MLSVVTKCQQLGQAFDGNAGERRVPRKEVLDAVRVAVAFEGVAAAEYKG